MTCDCIHEQQSARLSCDTSSKSSKSGKSEDNVDGKSGTGSSPERSTSCTISKSEESTSSDCDNLAGDNSKSKCVSMKRSSKSSSNAPQCHGSNLKFVRIYYGVAVGEFRWKVTCVSLRVQDTDEESKDKVDKKSKKRKNKVKVVPEEVNNEQSNQPDNGNVIRIENEQVIDSNGNKVNNVLNWISNVTNLIDGMY